MLQSFLSRTTLLFLSSTLAVVTVACQQKIGSEGSWSNGLLERRENTSETISNQNSPVNNLAESPKTEPVILPEQSAPETTPLPPEPAVNSFEMGLDRAIGAWSISQSAQSPDDWNLVASHYQEAIALMKKVPPHSPEFTTAQAKIYEYNSHLESAQKRAVPPATPPRNVIVAVPQPQIRQLPNLPPPISRNEQSRSAFITPGTEVFTVPIKRRMGGTPVVEVTFNNQQKFDMIVDTGASGTVITQEMANSLGVVTVGSIKANTASARTVEFPIGYVDSMSISGVRVNRVAVAIAGPELETGLLGHDFFGKYDVTIRRDVVEFTPQSPS
ncbi:TIGR02281 family clan AA aspartic protease [Nodularia chucula]|uniref:retropepsin-like aspartic protease family protein n=1 Tax=Nodularia chucula TaxID=3093667 RepID=UPI0039C6F408